MARYFFDIVDGGPHEDDVGSECADDEAVRREAMKVLPSIASDEIGADGDRRVFTVVARDDSGNAIYTASLSFVGLWVKKRDVPAGV